MAAARSTYVCNNCKARKKACDKRLPSCSYCTRKKIVCHYTDLNSTNHRLDKESTISKPWKLDRKDTSVDGLPSSARSDLLLLHSISDHAYMLPLSGFSCENNYSYDSLIHKRVSRLLQTTGLSITQIHDRYLHGLHVSLPIVQDDQFIDYEKAFGSFKPPSADISMLMLATSILVLDGNRTSQVTRLADQESLYLATKMLYSQVQVIASPSLPLVQAGILISAFEYVTDRWQAALLSVTACGALFRLYQFENKTGLESESKDSEGGFGDQIWWCIAILERLIACEMDCKLNLLAFQLPDASSLVPRDLGIRSDKDTKCNSAIMLKDITSGVHGLPSTAQAIWLLDRVFAFISLPEPIGLHKAHASALDQDLQSFLNTAMEVDAARGGCCASIGAAVRGMFLFHNHIVDKTHGLAKLEEWKDSSRRALDTATQIMLDLARSHADEQIFHNIDSTPPNLRYDCLAALEHLKESGRDDADGVEALKGLIGRIERRWGIGR